jgi:phenylalanyl-tRNA synthetase beta chain
VLGIAVDQEPVLAGLNRLGFEATLDSDECVLSVAVPTWRGDVLLPEDVIEEIARIVGYEHLPATLPTGTTPAVERDDIFSLERNVRRVLVAAGGIEARGYITVSAAEVERWALTPKQGFAHAIGRETLVRLRNAIPADRDILRPSIIPGLVRSVAENLKHEHSVRLFEIGHVFLGAGSGHQPSEPSTLGMAFAGSRDPFDRFNASQDASHQLDFFDVKGILESVLLRFPEANVSWSPLAHPALHPGRSAELTIDNERLGVLGEVRPDLGGALGIAETRVTVAELDLQRLLSASKTAQDTSITVDRFLPVEQDFAVIVDRATAAADVQQALVHGAGPLVTDVSLFDVFEGPQLGENKKSLAYRITFTAPDRALTDTELAKGRKRIEKSLAQRVGGSLRT